MKRKIEFRGKRSDTGEWVYGDLIQLDDKQFYIAEWTNWAKVMQNNSLELEVDEVIPETIGQFTGLKDKNGVKIYNGDTLIFPYVDPMGRLHNEEDFRKTVVFKYGCFGYETETRFIPLMDWMETETGEYVSNCGNKVIYTEKYPFWVEW